MRIAVLALCIFVSVEAAHSAESEVDVIPAEVTTRTLPKDTPIDVEVRLKAGDAELTAISISWFSNDGLSADVAIDTPTQLQKLAAKAEHSWRLKLTRDTGSILTKSVLHVRVAFDAAQPASVVNRGAGAAPGGTAADGTAPGGTPAAGSTAPTRHLIYKTVRIKPQAVVAGIELAKAEIKGAPETLAHERPGRMFIIVTNQYSRALTVTDVRPLGPTFVELSIPDAKKKQLPMEILPGQTGDIAYDIKAKSEVVPGKYPLIATVDLMTADKLAATVRTPVHEVNVVVLGESEILKFLGIPSLLFLPGVVMLLSWRFLWSRDKDKEVVKDYPIQWNTSDFWIIAIALSLLTAFIYPWLTSVFLHSSRNFVAAYGLLDFGLILAFALVATTLVFGGWRGWEAWRAHQAAVQAAEEARRIAEATPSTEDNPLQILDKLARVRNEALFEQYYVTNGDQHECLLALEPWCTKTDLWLVPPVELRNANEADPDGVDAKDLLLNGPPLDADALLTTLREGMERHWWDEPGWCTVGDIRRPMNVPRSGWTKSGHLARLPLGR